MNHLDKPVPEGETLVCGACGRTGQTLNSLKDTSCIMWAIRCFAGGPPWKAVTGEKAYSEMKVLP